MGVRKKGKRRAESKEKMGYRRWEMDIGGNRIEGRVEMSIQWFSQITECETLHDAWKRQALKSLACETSPVLGCQSERAPVDQTAQPLARLTPSKDHAAKQVARTQTSMY